MRPRGGFGLWRGALLTAALVASLVPLLWTALASLGVAVDSAYSPPRWRGPLGFEHFSEGVLSKSGFAASLLHSLGLALLTTALTTLSALLAAFALTRTRVKGLERAAHTLLLLTNLPLLAYLTPLREILTGLKLYDTWPGASLAGAALLAPLATYLLYGYLRRLPLEPEQAATLEGASPGRVLAQVVWPMSRPGVLATAGVVFALSWNAFLLPLATTFQLKTLPVALVDFFTFEREPDWPTAAAALMVALVPLLLILIPLHRALEHFSLAGFGDE